jgi:hypothetical protein
MQSFSVITRGEQEKARIREEGKLRRLKMKFGKGENEQEFRSNITENSKKYTNIKTSKIESWG